MPDPTGSRQLLIQHYCKFARMSSSTPSKRKRSKLACTPCRQRKRKCDGSQPCQTCNDLEYDCYYSTSKPKRYLPNAERSNKQVASVSHSSPSTSFSHETTKDQRPLDQLCSMEANSGAAFVRELAVSLDPTNAPRMHLFAWNAFFGARQIDRVIGSEISITDLLSAFDMKTLTMVYFEKVDPCYGFIDRQDVDCRVERRWASPQVKDGYDAVLCGIAALGCLFSRCQSIEVEFSLAETAKIDLEQKLSEMPDFPTVTAWVLRVAYLRMTSSPHTAWMASCLLMHTVEAAGLHCAPGAESILQPSSSVVNDELRRRLYGVAQHLNIWISFDMGRSRVILQNATITAPCQRPGNYTVELLGLLPYSEMLDPGKTTDAEDLELALVRVLERSHSEPPSILAQCNLVLCLYRRLRAANSGPPNGLMEQILALTARAVRAAQTLLNACSPWHHIANVPFQVICTLLAIDTPASLAQLEDAMQTLENVAITYNTQTLQEAMRTASLVISLHQRRKEVDSARLNSVLRRHPISASGPSNAQNVTTGDPQQQQLSSSTPLWLDEAVASIPYLQNFDIDDFLCDEFR